MFKTKTFNQLDQKHLALIIESSEQFSDQELHTMFMNIIRFRKDGSKFEDKTVVQRLTTLNKALKATSSINVLEDEARELIEQSKDEEKSQPQEKKEISIDADEMTDALTPYLGAFQDIQANKALFQDAFKRKERNQLIEKLNLVYVFLQTTSGCRISEVVEAEFKSNEDHIYYLQQKTNTPRTFIPLFISIGEWMAVLAKLREITDKESASAVAKRLNKFLKNIYATIQKTHTLRKIYFHMLKGIDNNPLGHNVNMSKYYDVIDINQEKGKDQVKEMKAPLQKTHGKVMCDACGVPVSKKNMSRHAKSFKHKANVNAKIIEIE